MSSSLPASSSSTPDSWAARRASAAFFFDTKAAPDEALAMRIRASRAFWNFIVLGLSKLSYYKLRFPDLDHVIPIWIILSQFGSFYPDFDHNNFF